ncbi:unnamed protein product [Urochloa humidicola]
MLRKRRSNGGFRLGRKLLGLWRWALCGRRRRRSGYLRLQHRCASTSGTVSGGDCGERTARKLPPVLQWGRSLARRLSLGWRTGGGHRALGGGGFGDGEPEEVTTPKGKVAVYVGGGEASLRYVVPVVYFNHPMFGRGAPQGGRGGVRVPTPRRHHHPLPRRAIRAGRRPRRRRQEGIRQVVAVVSSCSRCSNRLGGEEDRPLADAGRAGGGGGWCTYCTCVCVSIVKGALS